MNNIAIYSFYCSVNALWKACLCGKPTKTQSGLYDLMKEPKVGDFVLENSSGFLAIKEWKAGNKQAAVDHIKCMFGTLEEVVNEEYDLDDEARKDYLDNNEEIPTEKIWYITNLHGVRYRWHNADFIKVPSEYFYQ